MLDYRIILFSYLPCMIFAAFTGLAWLGVRLNVRAAIFAGITAAVLDVLARKMFIPMGIPPGWDLPVMVLILTVVLKVYSREGWAVAFGGSLISYILIAAGDYIIAPQILTVLGTTPEDMWKNTWLVVAIGNICASLLYLAGLSAVLGKFKIVDLSQIKVHS